MCSPLDDTGHSPGRLRLSLAGPAFTGSGIQGSPAPGGGQSRGRGTGTEPPQDHCRRGSMGRGCDCVGDGGVRRVVSGTSAPVPVDRTEPKPVIFDLGSGSQMRETSDWWVYDGALNAPLVTALRGACSCGRRAISHHPLDWQEAAAEGPEWHDTGGPEADWDQHITDIDDRTTPIPEDVAALLTQLRPAWTPWPSAHPSPRCPPSPPSNTPSPKPPAPPAHMARADDQPWTTTATALGLTETDTRTPNPPPPLHPALLTQVRWPGVVRRRPLRDLRTVDKEAGPGRERRQAESRRCVALHVRNVPAPACPGPGAAWKRAIPPRAKPQRSLRAVCPGPFGPRPRLDHGSWHPAVPTRLGLRSRGPPRPGRRMADQVRGSHPRGTLQPQNPQHRHARTRRLPHPVDQHLGRRQARGVAERAEQPALWSTASRPVTRTWPGRRRSCAESCLSVRRRGLRRGAWGRYDDARPRAPGRRDPAPASWPPSPSRSWTTGRYATSGTARSWYASWSSSPRASPPWPTPVAG